MNSILKTYNLIFFTFCGHSGNRVNQIIVLCVFQKKPV